MPSVLDSVGPIEFGRRPAGGQATLFDEAEVERETKPHEDKRPGEFAPKPKKPQTSGGQMLLVDSGVGDHPVERKPIESAMPPEVTAPKQPEPIDGQRELFQKTESTLEPVHHALGKRFGIPPEAVKDLLSTHPDELARRDQYSSPSNTDEPTADYEKFPLHTARISSINHSIGQPYESYVDYLSEFNPHDLAPTEPEDGIRKTGHFQNYLNWAKQGVKPPYINVYSQTNGKPQLVTSNRRRTLAAQDAGVKSITGWHGPFNTETGNPLKYGDVLKAAKEFVSSNKPAVVDTPEFKAWHAGSQVVGGDGKPLVLYHGTAHSFDSFAHGAADRNNTSDSKKAHFFTTSPDQAAEYGYHKGDFVGVHMPVYLNAKNLHSVDVRGGDYDPRFNNKAIDYAKANGHDGVLFRNQKDPWGRIADHYAVFHPRQVKSVFNKTFDQNDDRLNFSRDLESIGPVEFSSWDESQHPRESEFHDTKHPGEFAPEGGNGHELAQEDAARTERAQQSAATKPPETFASTGPLPKPYQFWEQAPLSEVLGDIPQRPAWMRKRSQVSKLPWSDAHEFAQHASPKYDVHIDDIIATMPAAHAHILDGLIDREAAKKDARKLTGLSARHEYADSDWSNIPRFDETAREVAGLHPIIGIRPDDHYAPQKMWDFIREGKLKLPNLNSPETADMAASMIASERNAAAKRDRIARAIPMPPIHFKDEAEAEQDDEREPEEDEWTVVNHGDTSFDPSQFSRESEVDDIAKTLGIDSSELLAAISDIDDGVRATIRNRNSTVIGIAVRNGNRIEIRDANSKLAGTITKAGGKSTFRSREGRSMGSVGEFSRVDGPVEFARYKPAEGQSVLDFDEPEQKPAKTKHRDGFGRAVNPRTGQVQARKGGEKSEVDGEWYTGGEWMPVHGLTKKPEPREKPLATPDSGTFKPNENQKPKYTEPRVLSPQDLDAAKQKKADQSKWDEIKSGPLGKVKWLGDSPNAKGMHYLTSMNQWHDYAEAAGPAEIRRITGELESVWKSKVREAAKHEKDLPEDSIQYWMDTPKQQAEQEIGMYPRANGTHEKRVPGSAYARQLVQHLLDGDSLKSDQRPIDNMHDIHRVLSGTYESEFSRDIGPVEFARHSFSSTQFNIEDAEHGRNRDPVAALMKLVKSIPTEHLHEGDHESPESLHVTVKYGIHTEDEDEIRSIVEGFGPVTIKLGKVSVFPANEKKSYDVVKVTVFGEDIRRLNKLISESTECTDTFPDYRPHITLALLEPGYGKKYAGNDSVDGMELTFDTLQFSDKDRKKTAISLTGGESEFSRDDDWIFAPIEDGPVEFARPIRPGAGQQSMGWSDDEQPHDVSSSNVHSFRFEPGGPGGGNLIVRYLNNKKDGPGPEYRYFTGGKSLYDQMNTDAKQQKSMGGFVWDHLRIRGSVAGHQVPFELAGTGPDKYVPRAAGLKRGHTGEYFNKRTFQGQESNLAPAPVRKSNGPIPGYDPKKLKLPGETAPAAAPTPPKPAATPASAPSAPPNNIAPPAASPPSPPAAPAPKKPSLIDRVLGFFRKKPKDQKPKEFSREEIRDIETVYAAIFREPANLKFDESRDPV